MEVSEHSSQLSDAAVRAATGRTPDEWFGILDAQGATSWPHSAIARWLVEKHDGIHDGIDGWWAQGVTVRYEQARGMRAPGQMADGTYTAGASKVIPGDQGEALEHAVAAFSEKLGMDPVSVNPTAKYPTARWRLPGGEIVLATVNPSHNGRTGIAMSHTKIADPERVGAAKAALASVLEQLATKLR